MESGEKPQAEWLSMLTVAHKVGVDSHTSFHRLHTRMAFHRPLCVSSELYEPATRAKISARISFGKLFTESCTECAGCEVALPGKHI